MEKIKRMHCNEEFVVESRLSGMRCDLLPRDGRREVKHTCRQLTPRAAINLKVLKWNKISPARSLSQIKLCLITAVANRDEMGFTLKRDDPIHSLKFALASTSEYITGHRLSGCLHAHWPALFLFSFFFCYCYAKKALKVRLTGSRALSISIWLEGQ